MTCSRFSSTRSPHPKLNAALVLATFASSLLFAGCATTASSTSESETPTEAAPAEPEEVAIEEEAPPVEKCHTDNQECDLPEPLPPGAACFCPGEDGANEAGTAGG